VLSPTTRKTKSRGRRGASEGGKEGKKEEGGGGEERANFLALTRILRREEGEEREEERVVYRDGRVRRYCFALIAYIENKPTSRGSRFEEKKKKGG